MKTMFLNAIVLGMTTLGSFGMAPAPKAAACCGDKCCDNCPACCQTDCCDADCCTDGCCGSCPTCCK